jgi:homopolymeric O-antigen transport system permease protein
MSGTFELTIRPRKGWQAVDLKEAYLYSELLLFLIWRDIKIRYRQTLLGGLWAVLQPFLAMTIFAFVFNRLAHVQSDGPPYKLFAFAGLAPWTFFSTAVTQSSNSLLANQQLVAKIYFPRIFIPLGAIFALLVDLILSLGLLAVLMVYYRWALTSAVIWLPLFLVAGILAASGTGLILSALNVRFRDVKYAVPFMIQMGLFLTPVIYPVHYVPARWQVLMGLNPMTGVVIGFRHALLGTPISWNVTAVSLVICVLLFVVGLFVFRRLESEFADIF